MHAPPDAQAHAPEHRQQRVHVPSADIQRMHRMLGRMHPQMQANENRRRIEAAPAWAGQACVVLPLGRYRILKINLRRWRRRWRDLEVPA